jgi:hypothetical protein
LPRLGGQNRPRCRGFGRKPSGTASRRRGRPEGLLGAKIWDQHLRDGARRPSPLHAPPVFLRHLGLGERTDSVTASEPHLPAPVRPLSAFLPPAANSLHPNRFLSFFFFQIFVAVLRHGSCRDGLLLQHQGGSVTTPLG